ncbi:hypothetical protein TNCV_2240951 [Trichonephila clavipes]|nr:hypothetical protein TNCV_2240951 [Trichonephila clavipes]
MNKVKGLLESMKKIQRQAMDKLEFINLHVSKHDCRNKVTEIKDLLKLFETSKSSFFCADIKHFRNVVAKLNNQFSSVQFSSVQALKKWRPG